MIENVAQNNKFQNCNVTETSSSSKAQVWAFIFKSLQIKCHGIKLEYCFLPEQSYLIAYDKLEVGLFHSNQIRKNYCRVIQGRLPFYKGISRLRAGDLSDVSEKISIYSSNITLKNNQGYH